VFEVLSTKVDSMLDDDGDCNAVFDEASLTVSNSFDEALKQYIGCVTFPELDTSILAKKTLVFMLCGIIARWKQVVAYHFTGDSFDGKYLKDILLDIVKRAEAIGLRVHNIVCDMAPTNMQMYKEFGIICGEHRVNSYKIAHPEDSARFLSFMPDPVHVIKI
jgi:hypothetical protein